MVIMERRHIVINEQSTTIGLESQYWKYIDALSSDDWKQWTNEQLIRRPEGMGRASWLRLQVLEGVTSAAG